MSYIRQAEKGHLPNGHGLLNETQAFIDAMHFVQSEDARWEKELKQRHENRHRE